MFNYVLFGIYTLAILFLAGFLVIFSMHVRGYLQYSKYIKSVFRVYLVAIIFITLFGGYMILGGTTPSLSSGSSSTQMRSLNF